MYYDIVIAQPNIVLKISIVLMKFFVTSSRNMLHKCAEGDGLNLRGWELNFSFEIKTCLAVL